jgi:TfoX/Sxy family transcriptional regulator of competence genes
MSSKQEIADYLVDQMNVSGNDVTAKKMFGEYGIFCQGKMVALVADDQLFIRPTIAGKEFIGEVEEAPPYPGAKNYYLIPEDQWDDSEWLSELIRITTPEVPLPKPKKKKLITNS